MFIVITGLDGSGTSTVAEALNKLDEGSFLLKTPSSEYASRNLIDKNVRDTSQLAHYLYYLSSVVYMSDYIKKNCDYTKNNVYCVRYLIDTVVSHQVAGLDVKLDYESLNILKPDKTIFVGIDENIRQERITKRGKSILDKVLDNSEKRTGFLDGFENLLDPTNTIYFNNNSETCFTEQILKLYNKLK